jgi:hypothetical protein
LLSLFLPIYSLNTNWERIGMWIWSSIYGDAFRVW